MKRKGTLLACVILSGISAGLFLLLFILVFALRNNDDFISGFMSGYGYTSMGASETISLFIIIFLLFALYALVKFVIVLLAFLKNSQGFTIASIVLCSVPVLYFLFSSLLDPSALLLLTYSGVELALVIIALVQINKEKITKIEIENL